MNQENYFNYFTEVEEYFVQKRGRSLIVSPLDWCLIEVWKESGVPLHVVLRGIDRSFDGAGKRRKQPPKTLFYCHPAVMEVYEEYRTGQSGSHEESDDSSGESLVDREDALATVERLQGIVQRREEAPYPRAGAQLEALAVELRRGGGVELEEIDRTLQGIGSRLAKDLFDSLSGEARKLLKKALRKELRIYKKRLSPEMFQKMEATYLERRIREQEGLPEFSLLASE